MIKPIAYLLLLSCCLACHTQNTEPLILVDMHNDVLSGTVMQGLDISEKLDVGNTDLPRLKEGGVNLQIFSVFASQEFTGREAYAMVQSQIDSLYAIAQRNSDRLELVHSLEQAKRSIAQGKIAGMIGVEGGHLLGDDLKHLEELKRQGVVYITLTWNNSNAFASSAADEANPDWQGVKGLSDAGKKLIERMNTLGIALDLAHVGKQAFFEALNFSRKPVLVSHANAGVLADVPRNLSDAQLKAVAENGGVIGVSFYSGFLDADYSSSIQAAMEKEPLLVDSLKTQGYATHDRLMAAFLKARPLLADSLQVPMATLLDHIDHMVQVAGIDHVGLGGDYYGLTTIPFPKGMEDVRGYPLLIDALKQRGYAGDDLRKLLGGNVMRVLKAQETVK